MRLYHWTENRHANRESVHSFSPEIRIILFPLLRIQDFLLWTIIGSWKWNKGFIQCCVKCSLYLWMLHVHEGGSQVTIDAIVGRFIEILSIDVPFKRVWEAWINRSEPRRACRSICNYYSAICNCYCAGLVYKSCMRTEEGIFVASIEWYKYQRHLNSQ